MTKASQRPPVPADLQPLRRVLEIASSSRTQLLEITDEVQKVVSESHCTAGICYLYVPHTTAGIIINEADDPAVARDIETVLDRLVPREARYQHAEGNSDAHVKCALAGVSENIWIEDGKLALGRWQGIFFCEFDGPRRRKVRVKIISD